MAKWLKGAPLEVVVIGERSETQGARARDALADLASTRRPNHLVVVASYEAVRAHAQALQVSEPLDLVVADEAHRLRNQGEGRIAFAGVRTFSRILLTATPMPNDLDEFYSVAQLVRPDLVGTPNEFNEDVARPIRRARLPSASEEDKAEGDVAAKLMQAITARLMLRRTSEELQRGLPPLTTAIVVCRPTAARQAC